MAVLDLDQLPEVLRLRPLGDDRYSVVSVGEPETRDVVFGGQVLAQSIVASSAHHPDKKVRSIHAVFSRAVRVSEPMELRVETNHVGRSFASDTVSAWQGGRLCVRALVLLDVDDPDVIRHQAEMPDVAGPDASPPLEMTEKVFPGSDLRIVDGVDTGDPDAATGLAELHLWTRLADAADHEVVNQAVIAYATNGFLVRTAMRPHPGVGGDLVHADLSTSVLSHTVTFHEPAPAREWLLLSNASPYAGRGRSYGEVEVFSRDGRFVASAVQHNMVRRFAERPFAGGPRTVM
jgi:acyl-CoA thioesterase-2